MNGNNSRSPAQVLASLFLISATALCGPEMTVTDTQGRALNIELISTDGENVVFRRKGSDRDFTLEMTKFDGASQSSITNEAKSLPAVLPTLLPEVVIGKRRQKGDSYYMVQQEITCTVKLRNSNMKTPFPKHAGKILFFGQNQMQSGVYMLLNVQNFAAELLPGASMETPLKPFTTNYDSDNKGRGNVGGYEYSGFLLLLLDNAGEVVFNYTTDGILRQAVANKPSLLKSFSTATIRSAYDAKMLPMDSGLAPGIIIR